jgi:hypothetical protein
MTWPSAQDYNEAVQHPENCFSDPDLRGGQPELTALGLPKPCTGSFATVYKLCCPSSDWAVRCFLHNIPDQEERYRHLTAFIQTDDLPETVTFEYQSNGIRLGSRSYPILKMQWVDGRPLLSHVAEQLKETERLTQLADQFFQSMQRMRAAGIAHGDLQHGNIIICGSEIRLVDYDGMYVPKLAGFKSNELGHANYQHPARQMSDFGDYLDNFSAWLIYLSLQMLARAPELAKYHAFDDCLIFKRADLRNPDRSPVFAGAGFHADSTVRSCAHAIKQCLELPLREIPALADTCEFFPSRQSSRVSAADTILWRLKKWLHDVRAPKNVPVIAVESPPGAVTPSASTGVQAASPAPTASWLQDWLPLTRAPSFSQEDVAPAKPAQVIPVRPHDPVPEHAVAAALHNIRQALQLSGNNDFPQAHALLSAALLVAGSDRRVRTEILRARARILSEEGHLLRDSKPVAAAVAYMDAKEALDELQQLRSGAPNKFDDVMDARILVALADCFERDGQFEKAVAALKEASNLVKRLPDMDKTAQHIRRKLDELK